MASGALPLQPRTAKTACVSKFATWTTRRSFLFARREKPGPHSMPAHGWHPPLLSLELAVASDQAQESRLCIRHAIDFRPSATPGRASSRLGSEFWIELTYRQSGSNFGRQSFTCGNDYVVATKQPGTCSSAITEYDTKRNGPR